MNLNWTEDWLCTKWTVLNASSRRGEPQLATSNLDWVRVTLTVCGRRPVPTIRLWNGCWRLRNVFWCEINDTLRNTVKANITEFAFYWAGMCVLYYSIYLYEAFVDWELNRVELARLVRIDAVRGLLTATFPRTRAAIHPGYTTAYSNYMGLIAGRPETVVEGWQCKIYWG